VEKLKEKEVVIELGNYGDKFYLILNGTVNVSIMFPVA
jgi:hypothetical protein